MTTVAVMILVAIVAVAFWGFVLRETGVTERPRDGEGCDRIGVPITEEDWAGKE